MRGLLLLAAVVVVPVAAATPDYVAIRKEVTVDKPVDAVWSRIGGWCAIAGWLKVTCQASGPAEAVGAIRQLNGATVEVMVARTPHSYTYWQTVGNMTPFAYHGTLAAEPASKGRTTLTYTLFYDQAAMPSDAVRASEHQRLDGRFGGALEEMKRLAEQR